KVGDGVLVLGSIAVLGAGSFGSLAIRFLIANTYEAAIPLVGILTSALYFHLLYTFLSAEIFFSKRTKGISIIFVVSAAVNLLSLLALVPVLGLIGAAVAQLIGGVVSVLMTLRIVAREAPIPIRARSVFA